MDLEQRLRESLVAPDPGAVFTARVMARVGRGPGRRTGFILVGTVLAVAAAAAMLTWRSWGAPDRQVVVEVEPATAPALPPVQSAAAGAVPDDNDAVLIVPAKPVVPDRSAEMAPEVVPAAAPPAPAELGVRYTLVATLRQDATDPDAREAADAFFRMVLNELRKVPDLTLRVRESADDPLPVEGEYGLTVASLVTEPGANGFTTARGSMGQGSFNATQMGYPWPLEWRVDRGGQTSARPLAGTVPLLLAREGAQRPAICSQRVLSDMGTGTLCLTGAELAVREVEKLRARTLPLDSGVFLLFSERVADGRLTERQRTVALNDLMFAARRKAEPSLDSRSAAAIVRLATDLPASRSLVWSLVRGAGNPDLVGPLLESMDRLVEEASRQEALTTLLEDYADDPRVRAGLQAVAREDPSALLRALAGHALDGADAWTRYVRENLDNPGLSPAEKVRPLVYASDEATGSVQKTMLEAMASDERIVDAVLAIARENEHETSIEQRGPIRRALYALIRSETGPVQPGSPRLQVQELYQQQTPSVPRMIENLRQATSQ